MAPALVVIGVCEIPRQVSALSELLMFILCFYLAVPLLHHLFNVISLIHLLVEIPIRLDSGVFSFFPALFSKFDYCLSRLARPADGIVTQTVQKTLPGSLSCLSKSGSCAVISRQISSKCTREVVYYLLYIPPLTFFVSVLSISRTVDQMRRE